MLGAVLGAQVAGGLQASPIVIGSFSVPVFVVGIVVGGLVGALLSVWVWYRFERAMAWVLGRLAHVSLRDVALGVVGLSAGLVLAFLIGFPLSRIPGVGNYLALAAAIALGYLGYNLVMQRREELAAPLTRLDRSGRGGMKARGTPKVLDTSVIIDGRVVDVVKAGFLEGPLLVSRSVLAELQRIADSSDTLRRNRGRRGLDVLHRLQQELQAVQVVEDSKDGGGDVDGALVALAKTVRGWIVTNDFNLNKVAELQGVRVLNVNELSQALRPVVLPGEDLTVQVIKDGKEAGQGVGYLDDGTMVVVEGGKKYIGETPEVVVTSVLQTVAGRMIFGRPKEAQGAPSDRR